MVEEQALVVVEVRGIGTPSVQVPRELQHVVGAAAFGGIGAHLQFRREPPRRGEPGFGVARPAGHVGARGAHFVEEVVGDVVEARVARNLVAARRRDRLRHMRVDMEPAQLIAALRKRIDEAPLLEPIAHGGPPGVLRLRREMVERLRDAAEFDGENLLHVLVGFRRRPLVRPRRHALEHLERLFVAGQPIHVPHAGHDLVDRVERRPDALLFLEAIPPRRRKGAQILAAEFLLALRHLGDHVVGLRLRGLVSGGGVQQRARREEMSGEMTAELAGALAVLRLLPAAQRLRGSGRQTCVGAERIEHALRVESGHVRAVPFLRLGVHAVWQQAHLRHRERLRPERNGPQREFQLCVERRRVGDEPSLRRRRPIGLPSLRRILRRRERRQRRARGDEAAEFATCQTSLVSHGDPHARAERSSFDKPVLSESLILRQAQDER